MRVLFLIVWTILLISCGTPKTFMYGEFEQVEYKDNRLILKKDSFEFINTHEPFDLAVYPCCGDRMAFGTWTQDKDTDYLRLSSPWNIMSSILDSQVKESKDQSDSLTFIITNPIEKHNDKVNNGLRELTYSIVLKTNNFKLDMYPQKFKETLIKIKRPKDTVVKSISIYVEPISNLGQPINTRAIDVTEYLVKDVTSNKFLIDIPQLTHEFISSMRLDNDFVKIVNADKLEWNGKYYKRKK
jgi:hypothetical protein